ncbi:MAG: hypothetical protein RL376_1899 [Verrucomicrobiota bacterium]
MLRSAFPKAVPVLFGTPSMSEAPRTPADFAEILAGDEPPLIVGGQAVNLWAEIYASQSPTLEVYAPFTSADADIYGTRALAETLAKRNGWECHFTNDPHSAAVAILVKPTRNNEPTLTIEVLNEINGLTENDLNMSTMIELENGAHYRTPSPLVLFKAKLYNLVSLANMDRPQDIRHARMLMQIIPLYFTELAAEHRAGRISEANLLGAVLYAGEVVLAPFAGNAARSHGLDLDELFPLSLRISGPLNVQIAINEICREVRIILGKPPSL